MAQAKAKAPSLDLQATEYWKGRTQNGAEGLVLLDKCIQRIATYRDWDALSRFVVQARIHGQGAKVGKIIRAAFGDKLTFKADSKHPTGGNFIMGWEGVFPLKGSNTYGAVKDAIQKGLPFDHNSLQKELPTAEKKERVATPEATAKAVKHVMSYLDKLAAEGFSSGEILAAVQKELAAKAVAKGGALVLDHPNAHVA